jgi:hypothetical protein
MLTQAFKDDALCLFATLFHSLQLSSHGELKRQNTGLAVSMANVTAWRLRMA